MRRGGEDAGRRGSEDASSRVSSFRLSRLASLISSSHASHLMSRPPRHGLFFNAKMQSGKGVKGLIGAMPTPHRPRTSHASRLTIALHFEALHTSSPEHACGRSRGRRMAVTVPCLPTAAPLPSPHDRFTLCVSKRLTPRRLVPHVSSHPRILASLPRALRILASSPHN